MNLVISPHNDDEALFMAYTIMREKPLVLVVTDSFIQPNRGEMGCDAETRWQESIKAMEMLGVPVVRMGIPDFMLGNKITDLAKSMATSFQGFDKVYAPALEEGGNEHHNLCNALARLAYGPKVQEYMTYTKENLHTEGDIEIIPTPEEVELKNKALDCYVSQRNLASTAPHFDAVRGKSEWLKKPLSQESQVKMVVT